MIDFNTILNTLFQAAVAEQTKPLLETIEAQDKRLKDMEKRTVDMEEFIARWNFGDEEKFKEAVKEIAKDVAIQYVDNAEERLNTRMDDAVEDIDVGDAVEKVLDNKDWATELNGTIEDEVTRQVEQLNIEDIVRDVLKNATVEISV